MKKNKWLIWLSVPLLFIILVVGLQLYYSYKVKSGIDKLLNSLSSFGSVSYQDISSQLFSPVQLKKVSIRPYSYADSIVINKVQLSFSDWASGFSFQDQLLLGKVSDSVNIKFEGLNYELFADYARPTHSDMPKEPSLNTLLCGDQTRIDSKALLAMGYSTLKANVDLSLSPSADNHLIKAKLSTKIQDMAQAELNLWLDVQAIQLSRREIAKSRIRLLGVSLADDGFNGRRKSYCGKKSGYIHDYAQVYRAKLKEWLKMDFPVQDRMLDALVNIQRPGLVAAARLRPTEPVTIGELAASGVGDDVFSYADFSISINGKVFEIYKQNWLIIKKLFARNVRKAAQAVVDEAPKQETKPKRDNPLKEIVPGVVPIRMPLAEKNYQPTSVAELANYHGSEIKVKTFFGREMEGVLVNTSGDTVSIRRHVQQGKVTFPIAKSKISYIEVYR